MIAVRKLHGRVPYAGPAAQAVARPLWVMPVANTDLMLQAMVDSTKAKVNEIVYRSRPVN